MRVRASVLALVVLSLGGTRAASPAEISGFVMGASPGETWGAGYGGMLTITLFNIVGGELEGSWQGGDVADTSIVSGAAKAYIGPSIGRLVPYVGLGAGAYRESLPRKTDTGTNGLFFAGVKLKFPFGLVVRGEYQWVHMPEDVSAPLDNRYFFAAGVSF
jgi:hypothetical protein